MSYHSELMAEYYCQRDYEESQTEDIGYGYATETAEHWAECPRLTFKAFLIGRKNHAEA